GARRLPSSGLVLDRPAFESEADARPTHLQTRCPPPAQTTTVRAGAVVAVETLLGWVSAPSAAAQSWVGSLPGQNLADGEDYNGKRPTARGRARQSALSFNSPPTTSPVSTRSVPNRGCLPLRPAPRC